VLLPLALALGVFSITASAQAWTLHEVNYGPVTLQPGGHPGSYYEAPGYPWATHTDITGNIAIYEGAGTVSVCQVTYDVTSGVNREGCGNNAVGNALNLTPYYGHQLAPGIRNNSPNVHTLRGVWYYGNP
jgi:hypothetical protein